MRQLRSAPPRSNESSLDLIVSKGKEGHISETSRRLDPFRFLSQGHWPKKTNRSCKVKCTWRKFSKESKEDPSHGPAALATPWLVTRHEWSEMKAPFMWKCCLDLSITGIFIDIAMWEAGGVNDRVIRRRENWMLSLNCFWKGFFWCVAHTKEKKIHRLASLGVMASEQQNIYSLLLITDAPEQRLHCRVSLQKNRGATCITICLPCHKAESTCLRFHWKLEQPLLKAS